MDNLKESFEEVADWCEKHLEEHRGQEIGMTFGRYSGPTGDWQDSRSVWRAKSGQRHSEN